MTREPWLLRMAALAERGLDHAEDLLRAGRLWRGVALVLAVMALSGALWLAAALMLALGRE